MTSVPDRHPAALLANAALISGAIVSAARGQQLDVLEPADGAQTLPVAVSADGMWVGGLAFRFGDGVAPIRWRLGSPAVEELGPYSNSGTALLTILTDGRMIGWNGPSGDGTWTTAGFVPVEESIAAVVATSPDGRVSLNSTIEGDASAIWIYRDGVPDLELGGPWSAATVGGGAISDDGRVAFSNLQWFDRQSAQWRNEAVRWIDGDLSFLPRGPFGVVAVSAATPDGTVAVGMSAYRFGELGRPVLWTATPAPMVIGPELQTATEVMLGGRAVLTTSSGDSGVWTPAAGWRRASDYFAAAGLPVSELHVQIRGASRDATVFAGSIIDDSGSVPIRMIVPPPCLADYTADGLLDFDDYGVFVACFAGDCPNYRSADLNFDGFVDAFDYLDFIEVYTRGC